jgi:hypothetical protein
LVIGQINSDGHLKFEWDGYLEDWSAIEFQVDDEIKFYDIDSGKWRTTFHKILKGEHDLVIK